MVVVRTIAAAVLVALAVCGPRAQDVAVPPDREAAVQRAWRLLTTALESGNLDEQRVAIVALSRAGTPRALSLVESVARTGSSSTRRVALAVLPEQPSYLPLLTEGFQDQDDDTRRVVIHKLGQVRDPRSVLLLQDILMAGDPALVESVSSSIRALAPLSLPALLQCLATCAELARQKAAITLHVMLAPVFPHEDARGNFEAFRRLSSEPVLVKCLDDPHPDVRLSAALVLARLGNPAGVDELVRATRDARSSSVLSKYVAMAALNALGRPGYLAPLVTGLSDAERAVRSDAAFGMRAFPHPSLYGAVMSVWRATSDFPAFIVLLSLGGSTDRALLRDALANKDPAVRF